MGVDLVVGAVSGKIKNPDKTFSIIRLEEKIGPEPAYKFHNLP